MDTSRNPPESRGLSRAIAALGHVEEKKHSQKLRPETERLDWSIVSNVRIECKTYLVPPHCYRRDRYTILLTVNFFHHA